MSSAGNDGHQSSTRWADEVAEEIRRLYEGGEAPFLKFAEIACTKPQNLEPMWTVQFGGVTPEEWKKKNGALPEGVLPETVGSYGERCVIQVQKPNIISRGLVTTYQLKVDDTWITLQDRNIPANLTVKIVEEKQAVPVAEAAEAAVGAGAEAGAGQVPPELLVAAAIPVGGIQTTTTGSSSDDEDGQLAPHLRWRRINGPRQAASRALIKF